MPIIVIISDREHTHKLTMNKGTFTVGRSGSCHVSLLDPMVSGQHLTLKLNDQDRVVVKDLESSNGTYLNGFKVDESIVALDDEVTVGDVKIWIDDSSLTATEKNFHGQSTQKTKLKFISLKHDRTGSINTRPTPEKEEVKAPISVSFDISDEDEDEQDTRVEETLLDAVRQAEPDPQLSDHPLVESMSKQEFQKQKATKKTRALRESSNETRKVIITTKNDQKEKTSLGTKIKKLWKK